MCKVTDQLMPMPCALHGQAVGRPSTVYLAGGHGNKVWRGVVRAGAQQGCGHAGRGPRLVVGWCLMCGVLSGVVARLGEGGVTAIILLECEYQR